MGMSDRMGQDAITLWVLPVQKRQPTDLRYAGLVPAPPPAPMRSNPGPTAAWHTTLPALWASKPGSSDGASPWHSSATVPDTRPCTTTHLQPLSDNSESYSGYTAKLLHVSAHFTLALTRELRPPQAAARFPQGESFRW